MLISKRHRRTNLVVLAALFAVAAVVPARAGGAATPRATSVDSVAFTITPSGTAVEADLTAAQVVPLLTVAPTLTNLGGQLDAVAITPTGAVVASSSATSSLAPMVPITTSTPLPAIAAASSLIAPAPGQLLLALRTTTGDVMVVTSSGGVAGSWQVTDLSTVLGTHVVAAGPVATVNSSGAVELLLTTTTGQLLQVLADGFGGHHWNAYNLSAIASVPTIVGSPSVGAVATDDGVEAIVARTTAGRLVAVINDNQGFTLWRSFTIPLPAGTLLGADPSLAVTAAGVVVAAPTTSSGLVIVSAATASGPWTSLDWTPQLAARKQSASAGFPVALVAGSTGVTVGLRATSGVLALLTAPSPTATPTVVDATNQPYSGELIASAPSLVTTASGLVAVALDGGPIPLIQRIVALAKSQDQLGASVVETPLNSNCNPYTAAFKRGWTTGCAKGTAAEEWCSDFANWVWMKAGADTSGITGYSYTFVDHGSRLGTFKAGATNSPHPGDAVVWGYASSHVGDHVGIVVGVKGNLIDVVSGNSGPATPQGYNVAVWDSGYFNPAASHDAGSDAIVGYITPTFPGASAPHATVVIHKGSPAQIAHQDGGR